LYEEFLNKDNRYPQKVHVEIEGPSENLDFHVVPSQKSVALKG
jgi:hypothetical protein